MGITEPRNDIEYVQTGQKGIAVAVDTITASSDVPKRMKPYDAARKSVIACVSDFAAKGVRPRFGLVSVTVPSSYDVKSIKETARGIADASKKFKIRMLGGDTSFGELSISICLFGLSKKPVGRIGAKTGDGIFTTGRFGYSAAGLHLMLSGKKPANSFEVKAKKAFCRPDARLDFGAAAARHFSSSIDSSDGLAMSLHELAQSSRKRFLLEKIPTPPGLEEFAKKHKIKSDDLLFYGGEEYEIVFTVPQKQRSAVLALAVKHRACLVQIGTVTTGNGVYLKTDSGITRIQQRGWKRHTV